MGAANFNEPVWGNFLPTDPFWEYVEKIWEVKPLSHWERLSVLLRYCRSGWEGVYLEIRGQPSISGDSLNRGFLLS
jgi:hypothetical protein